MSQMATPHIQPDDYDEVILVSRQYNILELGSIYSQLKATSIFSWK